MNDRAVILDKLKSANAGRERIPHPGAALPPQSASLKGQARLDRFIAEASKQYASIAEISSLDDLPGHLSDWLRGQNLPPECVVAPVLAPVFDDLDGASDAALSIRQGAARTSDMVGVSLALSAAAETGTVMMIADGATPTSINFVPDVEVIVISKKDIEAGLEGCWERLRAWKDQASTMPRAVNFITGPSRTADVEATMVLGAHGPRRLHLVLMDDRSPWPGNP